LEGTSLVLSPCHLTAKGKLNQNIYLKIYGRRTGSSTLDLHHSKLDAA